MAKVSFSKKSAAEYAALATKEQGRIYFVGDTADTSEVGEIYVDNKKYGGGGGGDQFSAAEEAYLRSLYTEHEQDALKARLTVAMTSSPSDASLFAGVTSVTYTLTCKWDNVLTDASSTPSGWTRKSVGTYTKTVSVSSDSVAQQSASLTCNGVTKSASVAAKSFYQPIIWGSHSGDPLATLPEFEASSGDQHAHGGGSSSNYDLYKKSSVITNISSFDNVTFTAHTDGAKFVVMIPTAVSGSSKAVTGSSASQFTMKNPENQLQSVTFVKATGWSIPGYAVFLSQSAQQSGATYVLSNV